MSILVSMRITTETALGLAVGVIDGLKFFISAVESARQDGKIRRSMYKELMGQGMEQLRRMTAIVTVAEFSVVNARADILMNTSVGLTFTDYQDLHVGNPYWMQRGNSVLALPKLSWFVRVMDWLHL